MRTFPASANGESCLGPVFRPLTDSDQHSFRYSYVISVFRHFLHKITNESVFEISIDIFSELVVSALKVSNGAKIRNRYNQVPHLTQDTNGKVTNSQKTPQTRAKRSALSQQVTTKHISTDAHKTYKDR